MKVGVEDVFGRSGPAVELLHIYGLDAENIVKKQSRRLSSRLPAENRPKGFQMAKSRFKKSTVAVAAAIIVVFAAAATAALIFLMSGKNKIPDADSQAIVYKSTDGGTYLSAYGKKHKLTISDDSSVLLTSDGEYLIYTTASAKVSRKYDLYLCSIKNSSKRQKRRKAFRLRR